MAETQKSKRIKKALDTFSKAMQKEGVAFFAGVVDKDPKQADMGRAYCNSDIKGEDFCYILDMALPTRQDAVNLGIWVGQLIQLRSKGHINKPL